MSSLMKFTLNDTRVPLAVSSLLKIPEIIDNYSAPELPAHFTTNLVQGFDNTPLDNVISDSIATLGRVLFYEKQLSANASISCASCHLQANGFSDPNQFSSGFQGGLTPRNSMGLANSQYYERGHFFWDERADTLEDQVLVPIQDNAFGDTNITAERISLALSQFIRSMVSYQSKYDIGVATNFVNFTASENRGRALFFSNQTNCGACHVNSRNNGNEAIFQPDRTFNNGLDAALVNDDNGVGDVLNNQNQNGRFKVGSLRNIELTAPYMHDGRFATLEEVVEHYNSGVQDHPNLDNRLQQNGNPVRMNLSDQEKQDLVAFMLTLTDDVFVNDPKLWHKLVLTIAGITGVVLILALYISDQSVKKGFLAYINQVEENRLASLEENLVEGYADNQNWDFIKNNRRLWHRYNRRTKSPLPRGDRLDSGPPMPLLRAMADKGDKAAKPPHLSGHRPPPPPRGEDGNRRHPPGGRRPPGGNLGIIR
ncbi:Methylamine utilization protein MauG [Nymphon striatum]|nr:Methylamine utilization protein MauG [Nymphon striatum]